MNIIVAVDRNFGIGRDGGLLFNIPEDKKFVRRMTLGKVLVMGKHTLLSLPCGKPLKDRVNIVLSHDAGFSPEGATMCRSMDELKTVLKQYDSDNVFVFGGQAVYEELIKYCKRAYVTKIDAVLPADKHFPNIDELDGWKFMESLVEGEHEGVGYAITLYENMTIKAFLI